MTDAKAFKGEMMQRLPEECLRSRPEDVFDFKLELGDGWNVNVFKAVHKKSGQELVVKHAPVGMYTEELMKEITFLEHCEGSPNVVNFFGTYITNSGIWLAMEYCDGGTVANIIKLRNKPLTEDEISTILADTLKGLEFIHSRRVIHRDIRAGNIMLDSAGTAKITDFKISGELTDRKPKAKDMMGTLFWMAPEIILENEYDCVADIWSFGITALEMADGKAPHCDLQPRQAMAMLPSLPPPTLRDPSMWSPVFTDFVSQCLIKNPDQRPTATKMLEHEFIVNRKSPGILSSMIAEVKGIRERFEH